MTPRDEPRLLPDDMNRLLATWFEEDARGAAPESIVDAALARSGATPRRSSPWLVTQWWPSIISELRLRLVPTPRQAVLLIVLALIVTLAAAAAYFGNHQRPAPFGPARNGLITFDDDGDIVVANPDGTGRRAITSGPALDSAPMFAPNGVLIAYFTRPSLQRRPASLVVLDANGTNPRVLDDGVGSYLSRGRSFGGGPVGGIVAQAAWSPDSTHLVYLHDESGSSTGFYGDLAIADVATGTWRYLLPGVRGADPTWSPDGSRIVFREVSDDLQSMYLDVVDPADDHMQRLAVPPGDEAAYAIPQFSPDGKFVVTFGDVWPHHIYIVPVDGSAARRLTRSGDDETWPTWSNDGTRIAWEVGGPAGPVDDVWIAQRDGTGAGRLEVGDVTGAPLYWSPDDTLLFGYQSSGNSIVVIPVDGGTPARTIPATGSSLTGNWQRLAPCVVELAFC